MAMTLSQRADALEHQMIEELDRKVVKSVLFTSGEKDPRQPIMPQGAARDQGKPKHFMMGDDPRLPRMPENPTLLDFFKYRFAPANHLLQSATHALKGGHSEKVVLACLLHDIAVSGFIRVDHGYWGAQLLEPYVDEEVSWAIRYHQALRFFPDESVGYAYPDAYIRYFGEDYRPEPYVEQAYQEARNHKWYMTSRLITLNDIYSFDPNAVVSMDDFIDIIGRNFKQPKEGLGFDGSPVAHMWRTIIWPTKFL
ncbi:HD domain-containing protein [Pigmentiphaga sp. YJ18]|uniref:HD domain-containing protein n=1 Tax=unclassified Pigmentiphaga TaxID=2626614 RepID=UPI00192E1A8D|nr:HD domain-containing protein [Pigmentiphaga sp. H8]